METCRSRYKEHINAANLRVDYLSLADCCADFDANQPFRSQLSTQISNTWRSWSQ
jgi:hypothetical protein